MASPELSNLDDLERGVHRHRNSTTGSYETEGSLCFSDVEDESNYSQFYSTVGDDYCFSCHSDNEIIGGGSSYSESRRVSSLSEVEVSADSVQEIKVHLVKVERDCRICHLSLDGGESESNEVPIELGCSCKDDLAVAHKNCAEAWFKIKGNKTCEICHSVARNVAGVHDSESIEQSTENNNNTLATESSAAVQATGSEPQRFWQGHRFLNFLLACMVFAFVISWLFHFNAPT